jgi:hypothetical protein
MGRPKEKMKCIQCGVLHNAVYYEGVRHVSCLNDECSKIGEKQIWELAGQEKKLFHISEGTEYALYIIYEPKLP